MSHPNDSDPNEPVENRQGERDGVEQPEVNPLEEPPTEKLPATDDATTVLPTVGSDSEATTELSTVREGLTDETTELPVAEQGALDSTAEIPAPTPTDATTELPVAEPDDAEPHDAEATTVLPAAVAAASTSSSKKKQDAEPGSDDPEEADAAHDRKRSKFGLKTAVLSVVVLLLIGVVGILSSELIARHLLAVCADEAAENVLHTKAKVDYDHSKFLLSSLLDHEIPYLAIEAKNGSVDKFDQDGQVQLKEAIKGLDVTARMENVHVTKDGGSVGHMTTQVIWTTEGIRQTLANHDLKGLDQNDSPINAVNSVKLDPTRNQFSIDVNGKIGPLQARAVVVVQPEIDKQHNLQIRIKSIDLPDFHNIVGFDVSAAANSIARPAIEQVAGKVASYPMGLKAKSVQVKSDSIIFQFYADNAPLVKGTKCSALHWLE